MKKTKAIFKIAIPIIIQGLVFQLQSLTDKAFLGNIDTIYISAIGAAQFPFNTTVDSFVALTMGLIIIIAQLCGAKRENEIKAYTKSGIFFNSIISAILFFIWFGMPDVIFRLLSVDEAIMPYSVQYVKICSFYFLVLGLDASLQAMLQGKGNTKPIMYAGVTKVGLNIFISWVLIFGHLGFRPLYMKGAAIGTLVANMISTLVLALYCFVIKGKEYALTSNKTEWFGFGRFKTIIGLGIPAAMEMLLWNVSNLVLIKFLNNFNYKATAIYTLTFGIEVVIYAMFSGTSKGTMTLMGQSIGAGKKKDANAFFYQCMMINMIIVGIATVAFIAFSRQILGIFSKDMEIIDKAVPFLIFTAVIMFPKSLNVVIGNAVRAYGDTRWMFISQVIGSIFVVSCSYVLIQIGHLHIVAIYITLFCDEFIRAAINYLHFSNCYKNSEVNRSIIA